MKKNYEPREALKKALELSDDREYLSEEYLTWCVKNQNYKEKSGWKYGNQIVSRKS